MSKSEEQFKCGYEVREAKMVWTSAEERYWIYWTKDAEDGDARHEENRGDSWT